MGSPEPTSRTLNQTDRVLLTLRRLLLTGGFTSGERLTELDLVSRLEASRTPVRHALTRLAHEGLLEALPKGGFRVCGFSLDEVWDAIELRGVLEGTAARLAAERLSDPAELVPIKEILEALDALLPLGEGNFGDYMELNGDFHRELLELSRSPMLIRLVDGIMRLPFASPGALVFAEDESEANRTATFAQLQHASIVEAIAERTGTRAEHLAREHARLARMNLEHALRDPLLFARLPGASLVMLPRAI
jgi:GntR family transcriptional regulator of vanillate catabolism